MILVDNLRKSFFALSFLILFTSCSNKIQLNNLNGYTFGTYYDIKFFSESKNFPLSYYKDKPFYVMRNDSLDRFGTKYEKRYSRQDIIKLFKKTGYKNIKISSKRPYWCAIGYN